MIDHTRARTTSASADFLRHVAVVNRCVVRHVMDVAFREGCPCSRTDVLPPDFDEPIVIDLCSRWVFHGLRRPVFDEYRVSLENTRFSSLDMSVPVHHGVPSDMS